MKMNPFPMVLDNINIYFRKWTKIRIRNPLVLYPDPYPASS
jgi:hypothetical protein